MVSTDILISVVIFVALLLGRIVSARNRTYNHQHIRSFGQRSFESSVRQYDKDIYHSLLNIIDEQKIAIRGFYHVTTGLPQWQEVLEEHLMIMDGKRFQSNLFTSRTQDKRKVMRISSGWSNVFDIVDGIHITFEGAQEEFNNMTSMLENLHIRSAKEKVDIEQFRRSDFETHFPAAGNEFSGVVSVLGELQTITELHQYCTDRHNANLTAYVFMMHNQETNCASDIETQFFASSELTSATFLQDIVNAFIIEFPAICLSALVGGYAACGTDFERGGYESNIWWANCEHIAEVPMQSYEQIVAQMLQAADSTGAADARIRAAASMIVGKKMLKDFLFNQLVQEQQQHHHHHHQQSLTAVTRNGRTIKKDEQYINRCAFNLHTGTKPTTKSHKAIAGIEVEYDSHCTRTDYRYSLIEVLSSLHDDSVLYNNRFMLPSLESDVFFKDYAKNVAVSPLHCFASSNV